MTYFPEPNPNHRAPRLFLNAARPAVIRFEDGRWSPAKLMAISLTGGLLQLNKPVVPGALIELVFMSQGGPVLGLAELLSPASATLRCLQPFKFIVIDDGNQEKLTQLISESIPANLAEPTLPGPGLSSSTTA